MSRSLMEAMAAGLPCIVSKIRGNVDLIEDEKGGYLVDPNDFNMLANRINTLAENVSIRIDMRNYNLESVKNYDIKNMQYYGQKLYMVDGPYENIKNTKPDDFYTMRAILEAKENSQIYGLD